jgi:micrococcal nuclease
LLALCLPATAGCPILREAVTARVAFVIDGDTVVLRGRERVRLIGIDAPEIGHDGAPDKPYAQAATDELKRALAMSAWSARIVPGRQRFDRYGRELAHLYDRSGHNLSERLLSLGLAYQVTVPPNDRFRTCYHEAESGARRHRRGLWHLPPLDAAKLPPDAEGFARLEGQVRKVRVGARAAWIDLAGALKLRIAASDLTRFDRSDLSALSGARVEVLGWIYRFRGKPRIRVRDPTALRRVAPAAD